MTSFKVITRMETELIYRAEQEGRGVVIDAGSGENRGQTPMELFLSALTGCATVDVIEILKKRRKRIDRLEIVTEAQRRDEPFPRIFTHIKIIFQLTSPDANQAELDRAVALSMDKYCSVRGMVSPEVAIETEGKIIRP